jgi:hypothetical protein
MKMRATKLIQLVTLIVVQIVTIAAHAYIPDQQRTYNFGFQNRCRDFRTAEDYSNIPMIHSLREMNQRDIAAIIPMSSLQDSNNGGNVASKILAHSLNSFFKSETIQNTGIGRTAASVERSMDTNVAMGGLDEGTTHTLKFKMKATDARAILAYDGFIDSQISYQVGHDKELKVSMFQKLNDKAKLVFDSIARSDDTIQNDTIQKVSLNLSF